MIKQSLNQVVTNYNSTVILSVTQKLRVNVSKNQTYQENHGHSSNCQFAHILSVGRYYYNTHGNNADLFKYLLVSEKNHINR